MALVEELSRLTAEVAQATEGAVVRIGRDGGRGAGTVIGEGLVLTSAHNLRGAEVTVTFADGRVVTGQVKGTDMDADLAVVAADTGAVTPIAWSAEDSGDIVLGTLVFAPAIPHAASGIRVTFGSVSSTGVTFRGPRGRLITDSFEHTAPVGRGSSGGPVVDAGGRLVGVNTHRPGDGFYLAQPVTADLKARVDSLSRGEAPRRRRLGVALTPSHVARRLRAAVGLAPHDGVLIRDVSDGSPAAAAGLQRGDLIVAAAGTDVESIDALMQVVDRIGSEATLALTVLRGAEEIAVEVRFDPDAPDAPAEP